MLRTSCLTAMLLCVSFSAASRAADIPNPLIDSKGFRQDTREALARRKTRRVTEKQFLKIEVAITYLLFKLLTQY